jgi:hypothetical protein
MRHLSRRQGMLTFCIGVSGQPRLHAAGAVAIRVERSKRFAES